MNKYICILLLIVCVGCNTSKKTSRTTVDRSVTASTSQVVSDAKKLQKRPYRFGGTTPSGFDCSGFVMYVYDKNGVQLPRRSADQARFGRSIDLKSARPGDLIFFKKGGQINHVGIVSDVRGKYPSMIHASSSRGVIETDLDVDEYWRKRFAYIRRL